MDVSIVIPAYKEAKKIERDVAAADAFLRSRKDGGEILLVDDGSPDGTAAAARALQSTYPLLRVVSYARNRGKGHAIAQGVMQARGSVVMFADAGLCVPYDIATIGISMLELDMCDVAHGSRRMRGSVLRAQPLYRRLGSLAYKAIVHAAMGVPRYISDTQCGFKIYRRDVARELYGDLLTDGFMFDVEIILRALRKNYRILEFPVLWSNDADTRFDPVKGTIRNLRELARIRWSLATENREGAALRAERASRREDALVT
jgi:glycosyltransferase involved in cell wall biosynthesis